MRAADLPIRHLVIPAQAQTYGVFAVRRYDKIGAELYLGARNHELDRSGSNFDDVMAVIIGGKVRF